MLHMDIWITLVYASILGGAGWAAAVLVLRGLKRSAVRVAVPNGAAKGAGK